MAESPQDKGTAPQHLETTPSDISSTGPANEAVKEKTLRNINAKLANPLSGYSLETLQEMGAKYARENGMEEYQDDFRKGAMLAQNPKAYDTLPLLTDEDRHILEREVTHKWSHPAPLYHMVVMCSLAAAVQGMGMSRFLWPRELLTFVVRRVRYQWRKLVFHQAVRHRA
jgi:hypothetical protein